MTKYNIEDQDIGIDYRDVGINRTYELTAYGDNFVDLVQNAAVTELNDDGGEITTYDLNDAPADVLHESLRLLMSKVGLRR